MLRAIRLRIWIAGVAAVVATTPAPADDLETLAEVGPWPAVTGLIGYNGRLWFANAVRYPDHNSADVYSLDPARRAVRYERHLFSQDVGHPAIANGLLYWPFEDARISLGWGQYAVTNGVDWRLGVVPTAQIFHVHALAEHDGTLIAAASAWRAGLHESPDFGQRWRQVYDRPTPERRVSRIVELVPHNGALYGSGVDRLAEGPRFSLLRFDGADPFEPAGWPRNAQVSGLAAHGDWLYGIVAQPGGGVIWRTDGRRSEPVLRATAGLSLRDIVAGPQGLWAVGAVRDGGALWFSADGRAWSYVQDLYGGTPADVAVLGDRVFVGGRGNTGRGILWGSPAADVDTPASAVAPMLALAPAGIDWPAMAQRLDALLVDPASYASRDTELRQVLFAVGQNRPPQGFLEERLATAVPDVPLRRFGGAGRVTTPKLARFMLMWAMAYSRTGTVAADEFTADWVADDRRSQKFVEPVIGAMWAVSWTGQRDRDIIEALLDRLERPDDPLWLKGDAVGALSAITGQRFGYDFAAWRGWWDTAGAGWN